MSRMLDESGGMLDTDIFSVLHDGFAIIDREMAKLHHMRSLKPARIGRNSFLLDVSPGEGRSTLRIFMCGLPVDETIFRNALRKMFLTGEYIPNRFFTDNEVMLYRESLDGGHFVSNISASHQDRGVTFKFVRQGASGSIAFWQSVISSLRTLFESCAVNYAAMDHICERFSAARSSNDDANLRFDLIRFPQIQSTLSWFLHEVNAALKNAMSWGYQYTQDISQLILRLHCDPRAFVHVKHLINEVISRGAIHVSFCIRAAENNLEHAKESLIKTSMPPATLFDQQDITVFDAFSYSVNGFASLHHLFQALGSGAAHQRLAIRGANYQQLLAAADWILSIVATKILWHDNAVLQWDSSLVWDGSEIPTIHIDISVYGCDMGTVLGQINLEYARRGQYFTNDCLAATGYLTEQRQMRGEPGMHAASVRIIYKNLIQLDPQPPLSAPVSQGALFNVSEGQDHPFSHRVLKRTMSASL